jgi:tetratricopeptide (TPR) repeat protein
MSRRAAPRRSLRKLLAVLAGVGVLAILVASLLPRANKSGTSNAPGQAPLQLATAPRADGAPSNNFALLMDTNRVDFDHLPASNVVAAVLADPSMPEDDRIGFLVNKGNVYLASQRPADALMLFDAALQQRPDDEDLHFNRGISLARLGRIEEAKKAYEAALQLFPDYGEAHNNLGNLLASQGNLAEAAQHFQAALKASPENASAHNNLGSVLARQKQYEAALEQFLLATRFQTNYVEAHFNVGGAYLELGRLDEAAAKFIEILQVHPDFRPAQIGLERVRKRRQ